MILKRVTVTGADDSIDPLALDEIAAEFPFVEFGILLSKNNEGTRRFPSRKWIGTLVMRPTPMKLSAHLCGRWVRDLCIGNTGILDDWVGQYLSMFGRIQLNFHAEPTRANAGFVRALWALKKPIIFQMDGVNENLLEQTKTYHVDAYALYDLSGGCGVLPEKWFAPLGSYCGYAGGLSPENLEEQLEKLSQVVGETPIWIDAETHLRSNDDKQFDLVKVRKFLEIARPYVEKK